MFDTSIASSESARRSRRVLRALLPSTAISAGGIGYAVSEAMSVTSTAPISVTPANPQMGFAPLVARVKPAVVQITTTSHLNGVQQQEAQQFQNLPDLPERGAQVASTGQENGIKPVGMSLESLTVEDRVRLNMPAATAGVIVGQVTPGSSADEKRSYAGRCHRTGRQHTDAFA